MFLSYTIEKRFSELVDHNASNSIINHNAPNGQSMNLSTRGYHIETVPISSQKFKEYLMQIYREDSELQEELAIGALEQSKDRVLEDEVDKNLRKDYATDNRKCRRRSMKNQ